VIWRSIRRRSPARLSRNAASTSALMLTTEALVSGIPEEVSTGPAPPSIQKTANYRYLKPILVCLVMPDATGEASIGGGVS
jgi:hypothetical protein